MPLPPNRQLETRLMHSGETRREHHGAVVPPLFQNSLFTFENWDAIDAAFDDRTNAYIYSRVGNPTVRLAETKIAELAGGERARLFASGMGAISAVPALRRRFIREAAGLTGDLPRLMRG